MTEAWEAAQTLRLAAGATMEMAREEARRALPDESMTVIEEVATELRRRYMLVRIIT